MAQDLFILGQSIRPERKDGEDSPEFRYLRMILEGVGLLGKIRSGLPATLARWHLPSHPLDPAGFHRLELSLLEEGRLLYDLVDEAVERLLRPCLGIKPWEHYRAGNSRAVVTIMRKKDGGEALLWHLWSRLRGFQQEGKGMTQLETLHLVEDFEDWNGVRCFASHPPVRKEMEAVVAFLEAAIVDSLMEEECHGLDLNLNNMLYNEWDL
ncbi:unnamed protein product [Spirodela intermedia]|uniref:DUF4378 domain-containing protein n=1 Tax=Spirodela intermedia TaxID=51605 RepID=A0A7I8JBW7_SPIIN|nr:unnamed protein product [Spirodela intermedia]CAA6666973.1 unnamed protein product [Spirodela intermedia]